MSTPDKLSSGQAARQAGSVASVPDQEELPRPAGNRLFFWLLVAAAFFILDMAILLYVFRPTADNITVERVPAAAAVQQDEGRPHGVPPVRE